jgi:hypothetical protein
MRAAGVTPVAREGTRVLISTCHSSSWRWRSASSTKRRCLKKEFFHPADDALHRALLVAAARRAQLDADAQLEHHRGEGGIVFVGPQNNGLGSIEHGHERNATHGVEVLDERAHERLDGLVRNEGDLRPARVLQP